MIFYLIYERSTPIAIQGKIEDQIERHFRNTRN